MADVGEQVFPEIPGYQIIEEVGRGATSRVFRACQRALDREVALKVITTWGGPGQKRALRLFREARLAGALDHPGLVRGIDAGEGDGLVWFAMDFVEGSSLQEILDERGRISVGEAVELGIQTLEALDHAHRRGVVHRDIKPANILVDLDGQVRVLDLGLAKRPIDPGLTMEGGAVGTPQYMAPEQATDPDAVDARADLFSLGSTLYRAICGEAPFDAPTVAQVLTRLLHGEPRHPSRCVRGLTQAVDLVLLKALQKAPFRRYQTAVEFAADLRALRAGRQPLSAKRRNRIPWFLAGGAALAAMAVVLSLAWPDKGGGDGSGVDIAAARERQRTDRLIERLEALESHETLPTFARLQEVRRLIGSEGKETPLVAAVRTRLEKKLQAGIDDVLLEAERVARLSLAGFDEKTATSNVDLVRARLLQRLGLPDPISDDPALERDVATRVAALREHIRLAIDSRRAELLSAARSHLQSWFDNRRDALLLPAVIQAEAESRIEEAGPIAFLTPEGRKELEDLSHTLQQRLHAVPRTKWEGAVLRTQSLIDERRLASAQALLEQWLRDVRHLVPEAESRARGLEETIARRTAEELQRVRVIRDDLARAEVGGLDQETRTKRLARMKEALREVGDPSEVLGLGPELTTTRELVSVMGIATRLRDEVLDVVPYAVESANRLSFPPWVRHHGAVGTRTLLGKKGRRLLTEDATGFARDYAIDDLLAPTVADLYRHFGGDPSPAAVALLAYLDGDDHLALELSEQLPADDPATETLLALSRSGVARRLAAFDSEGDREAYQLLVEAQRKMAAGDGGAAREAVAAIRSKFRTAVSRRGRFFQEFNGEVQHLSRRLEALEAIQVGWKAFGTALSADAESRRLHVNVPLDAATPDAPWRRIPPGGELTAEGLHVGVPVPALATVPPDRVPPVIIDIPALDGPSFEVAFSIRFHPGPLPPAFLSVSLHDIHFMAVDSLLDGRPYRTFAFHGLEGELSRRTRVGRVGFWNGDLAAYRAEVVPRPNAPHLPVGESLPVRLTKDAGGGLSLTLGKATFPLPAGARPALQEGGLRIAAFPAFTLSGLTITAQLEDDSKR